MSEWQAIETAPKNGERILLARIDATKGLPEFGIHACTTFVWWACAGSWSEKYSRWWDGIEPCGLAGPNYWMPLPPPPSTT